MLHLVATDFNMLPYSDFLMTVLFQALMLKPLNIHAPATGTYTLATGTHALANEHPWSTTIGNHAL